MKIINKNNTPEAIYTKYRERQAVRVIVQKKDGILVLYSENYDSYSLPGGGVEAGETLIEAAKRELIEETGLTIDTFTQIAEAMEVYDEKQVLNCTTCFIAEINSEKITLQQSYEDDQIIKWVDSSNIIELFHPSGSLRSYSGLERDIYFLNFHSDRIRSN